MVVARRRKLFIAVFACVRGVAGVHPLMDYEVTFAREMLAANFAALSFHFAGEGLALRTLLVFVGVLILHLVVGAVVELVNMGSIWDSGRTVMN